MTDVFLRVFQISAVSSAVILAVFIYRTAFGKRIKYSVLALLWAMVLLRLCLPFTFESPVHFSEILPQKQAAVQEQKPADDISAADISAADSIVSSVPDYNAGTDKLADDSDTSRDNVTYYNPDTGSQYSLQSDTPSYAKPQPAPIKIDWLGIAAYIWIAGACVILMIAFSRGVSFGRKVSRCGGCEKAELIADELRQELKIRRMVSVKVFGETAAPAMFGLIRPKLLLPESCVNVSDDTLRCILTHELCHVKRLDILKGYIWLAAKAVHWFNPLVWIAYRAFRDDMEICCDEMVLKVLGRESRFMYSLSLIDAFRSYGRALPGAVPLFEKEPELAERVKRMLKPKKRSKAAAVLSVLLALIIALAGFTTACSPAAQTGGTTNTAQQTTAEPPTVQQTTASSASPSPSPSASPEPNTVSQWTDNVKSGKFTLDVNAQVVTPNVTSFPLYNVKDAAVPQDTVDKLKTYFFGDATVYNYTQRMMDEEDIKESTAQYQAMQDGTYKFDKDDDKKGMMHSLKVHIDYAKKLLKKEPDTGLVPLDLNLSTNKGDINGITGSGDKLSIYPDTINLSKFDPHLVSDVNSEYVGPLTAVTITKEQALTKAQSLLDELGLNDFKFYHDCSDRVFVNKYLSNIGNTGLYTYDFVFTRVVGGVQIAGGYSKPTFGVKDTKTENKSHDNFTEEKIKISVNDSGIQGFIWFSPLSTEPANSNTQLKGVEDIKKEAEDQLLKKYGDSMGQKNSYIGGAEDFTLHITSMKLEYARVPINGDYDTPYLVPVWNVYGTYSKSYWITSDDIKTLKKFDRNYAAIELTINALDGSVIGNQSNYTY